MGFARKLTTSRHSLHVLNLRHQMTSFVYFPNGGCNQAKFSNCVKSQFLPKMGKNTHPKKVKKIKVKSQELDDSEMESNIDTSKIKSPKMVRTRSKRSLPMEDLNQSNEPKAKQSKITVKNTGKSATKNLTKATGRAINNNALPVEEPVVGTARSLIKVIKVRKGQSLKSPKVKGQKAIVTNVVVENTEEMDQIEPIYGRAAEAVNDGVVVSVAPGEDPYSDEEQEDGPLSKNFSSDEEQDRMERREEYSETISETESQSEVEDSEIAFNHRSSGRSRSRSRLR